MAHIMHMAQHCINHGNHDIRSTIAVTISLTIASTVASPIVLEIPFGFYDSICCIATVGHAIGHRVVAFSLAFLEFACWMRRALKLLYNYCGLLHILFYIYFIAIAPQPRSLTIAYSSSIQ